MEKEMVKMTSNEIDFEKDKYPFCLVWTPIPILTYLFPFIGHMGIAMSNGVIRDFAGAYCVSEDNMAFGRPTRYLQLNPNNVLGGVEKWDESVTKACTVYQGRVHNLLCDNCHSHCALALNTMCYKNVRSYNMFLLASWMFILGSYVGFSGFLKTWLPNFILIITLVLLCIYA